MKEKYYIIDHKYYDYNRIKNEYQAPYCIGATIIATSALYLGTRILSNTFGLEGIERSMAETATFSLGLFPAIMAGTNIGFKLAEINAKKTHKRRAQTRSEEITTGNHTKIIPTSIQFHSHYTKSNNS